LSASIGVVMADGPGSGAALIEAADEAMYRAKRRGGAAVELVGEVDLRAASPDGSR